MRIPEFRTKVDGLFSEYLAGREQELLDWLDSRAMKIYFAAQRNKERWGSEEFGDSILELRKWIMARYDYMEDEYGE